MSIELSTALLFISLLLLLALGLPIAFAIGGIAVIFTYFLLGQSGLFLFGGSVFRQLTSFLFAALPLFVFMGHMLERSGIADDLYQMFFVWMGPLRGGLAIGTIFICTLFAAMAGVSAAATVTMGIVALPSMLKRGYNKQLALGCIGAGGALGVLIPPSVIMILYGAFSGESIGRLYAGGIFPGLILAGLFSLYIGVRSFIQKDLAPAIPKEERASWGQRISSLRAVILPILLIVAVLGSIFGGLATPTEAAAVGALGSVLCSAIYRRLTLKALYEAAYRTLGTTCMILWIVVAVTAFTSFYTSAGAQDLIKKILLGLPISPIMLIIAIQVIWFILGCFLDPAGIIMITVPIFVPVIKALGFDPVWFGVLFVVNMEMAYLTPPYGVNLFYLKGVAPPGVTMADIYRSIGPFVALQAVALVLVMMFPQIILYLPNLLLGVVKG